MTAEERTTLTVRVSNIHQAAVAKDLFDFFELAIGKGCVFACEIFSEHKNWKSRGVGRVQFETLQAKSASLALSQLESLVFRGANLSLSSSFDDAIIRPIEPRNRVDNGVLYTGFLAEEDFMRVLESWEGVKTWVMPERKSIEFWLWHGKECYKLEVQFGDVLEVCRCCLDGEKSSALLLKLKYAPKMYQRLCGPNVATKFGNDRYHSCKEDFDFLWVRTKDFSNVQSIGKSSSVCWKFEEELSILDMLTNFPFHKKDVIELTMEEERECCSASDLVPLLGCPLDTKLPYEIIFQLNSLVHTQKLSFAAVDSDLIDTLSGLDAETAIVVLQKMHKLQSTCYEPVPFIKTWLHVLNKSCKNLPLSRGRLTNYGAMSCHRVLITPSKIYCLGPELETSNYVVKHFSSYVSDFLRVTFVEEDWSKLPSHAISTSIQQGIFSKPYRTSIYHRVVSILQEGIVIGAKRFQFLAFSASQLRSNSVWMFASNEHVSAEDIREWMGCFSKIRSVSKCAARMGQLFSTSMQTLEVPAQHVEVIPDVDVISEGVGYCFSDGIGKISLSFARQVAQKCGLNDTPSAFQIRYGGYKGVIVVDRSSFRKLSLRSSMLKFESKNRMLNVTKWSESSPCYLNREIVTLLSTLGVKDFVFVAMQDKQLHLLGKMMTSREAALHVLQGMMGSDVKSILANMLLQGYEPNLEPYVSLMLQSHHDNLVSDLRTRCRIFVPKGRILIGCLDETANLNYGQVYIRLTTKKSERECGEQTFFHKVDETTAVVKGKVVVTKNPCLHPGDVRVLEAVYVEALVENGLVDCVVFPQKGERPHPNECSGGDLDGDIYFISWDEDLIPSRTVAPMDYTGRRPRIMDHDVTLEEIQNFFVEYMINDTLGAISTAHLVHADREPDKALSAKCLQLATLHSMAVDFAKTGAPAEIPRALRPKEFPDFLERWEKPTYTSQGVLGKLYRASTNSTVQKGTSLVWSEKMVQDAHDNDLEVEGFEAFLEIAESHKEMYVDKITALMNYYGAETEDEILTGNLRNKSMYLKRDNRRYGELKDRIVVSIKNLKKEAKGWFESGCKAQQDQEKMASAWYHVTYHPTYSKESANCLGFPWIVGDVLMNIKFASIKKKQQKVEM